MSGPETDGSFLERMGIESKQLVMYGGKGFSRKDKKESFPGAHDRKSELIKGSRLCVIGVFDNQLYIFAL